MIVDELVWIVFYSGYEFGLVGRCIFWVEFCFVICEDNLGFLIRKVVICFQGDRIDVCIIV